MVCGLTDAGEMLTLAQWKPGVNQVSWELAPGGIGKVEESATQADLLDKTQTVYRLETGYGGGTWNYLGSGDVETAKYRGASLGSHGLPAHYWLATNLKQVAEPRLRSDEIIHTILVPPGEIREVIESEHFNEISAQACALRAMLRLGRIAWR